LPAGSARGEGALVLAARPVEHSHGGRTHTHAPLPDGPLSWKTLVSMGVAGGLVPSPSALLVLLGATALGRAWFGVLLVLAYGVGMAVTLTIAGLLLLRAQALLDRRGWSVGRGRRLVALLPLITAGIVVVIGVLLVLRGISTGRGLL
jgi:ABC-type nickel/cobalt efflux system permease component RcnA